jgi:hypothetical protein
MSEADKVKKKRDEAQASAQRPLRVTDAEFAVRKMHDAFIAAQARPLHRPHTALAPRASLSALPPGPQLRRTIVTHPPPLLQPVLSRRVAAMFEARYGCHPVVSGEPNWLVELKKLLGDTMKPFVKLGGPWDM